MSAVFSRAIQKADHNRCNSFLFSVALKSTRCTEPPQSENKSIFFFIGRTERIIIRSARKRAQVVCCFLASSFSVFDAFSSVFDSLRCAAQQQGSAVCRCCCCCLFVYFLAAVFTGTHRGYRTLSCTPAAHPTSRWRRGCAASWGETPRKTPSPSCSCA